MAALSAANLDDKISLTRQAAWGWFSGGIGPGGDVALPVPSRPGRPEQPNLVAPSQLKRRSLRSEKGRFALLHAIAHIELNAIDLALDVVARFCDPKHQMPRSFYDGWMRVALEEAKHFSLLRERLAQIGGAYGDLDAHDGLWEAAQETGHSLDARLAVVPLILEARGLDITPSLLRQMDEVGDHDSRRIFEIIYRDEEGHVAVGAKWFRFLCLRRGISPSHEFQRLVRLHFRGPLKPPFNDLARARAGLTPGFYRALSSAGT
ncbi:ferritin-like domain-containing protein [Ahrensia sp. R2A130]|uniref:ferritin-like domain-containing protein n=1 Tax=Ahrensia sp. R2A130 TaxID=744979 RepID=UPI00067FBAB1|nr:ferritin-like domain-containing protein [Ahrensia sp. R2A130]